MYLSPWTMETNSRGFTDWMMNAEHFVIGQYKKGSLPADDCYELKGHRIFVPKETIEAMQGKRMVYKQVESHGSTRRVLMPEDDPRNRL